MSSTRVPVHAWLVHGGRVHITDSFCMWTTVLVIRGFWIVPWWRPLSVAGGCPRIDLIQLEGDSVGFLLACFNWAQCVNGFPSVLVAPP